MKSFLPASTDLHSMDNDDVEQRLDQSRRLRHVTYVLESVKENYGIRVATMEYRDKTNFLFTYPRTNALSDKDYGNDRLTN
jgi:hypothetical protein